MFEALEARALECVSTTSAIVPAAAEATGTSNDTATATIKLIEADFSAMDDHGVAGGDGAADDGGGGGGDGGDGVRTADSTATGR